MAKLGLKHTSEAQTRDKYTKVNMDLSLVIEGKEIPTAAVLGDALEDAVRLIQERIAKSYEVVPARNDTPPANSVVTENAVVNAVLNPDTPVQPVSTGGLGFPPSQ